MSTPTTRCKFRCDEVNLRYWGAEIKLNAVSPNKNVDGYEHGEDHAFWNATPSGAMVMTIQNAYGAELFQPGKSYYLDISEAAS